MSRIPPRFQLEDSPIGPGVRLLEASAGTGKTWSLAGLYARLVVEAELRPREILAVTFTDAATAELRTKLRLRLQSLLLEADVPTATSDAAWVAIRRTVSAEVARARLRAAIAGFDEAAVFTIHGFCQRVLQDEPFLCGVDLRFDIEPDERRLLVEVAGDFWRRLMAAPTSLEAALADAGELSPDKLLAIGKALRESSPDVRFEFGSQPASCVAEATANVESSIRKLQQVSPESTEAFLCSLEALVAQGYLGGAQKSYGPARMAELRDCLGRCLAPGHAWSPQDFSTLAWLQRNTLVDKLLRKAKGNADLVPMHPLSQAAEELTLAVAAWRATVLQDWAGQCSAGLDRLERTRGVMTFAGLLRRVAGAMAGPRGPALAESLAARFPAGLIDEFQDTDPWQWAVFEKIFRRPGQRLFLIGDPKQAIYGFRGADLETYLRVAEGLEVSTGGLGDPAAPLGTAAEKATLGTNWRSAPNLIHAVNTLFSNGMPFGPRIAFDPVSAGRPDSVLEWNGVPTRKRLGWLRIGDGDEKAKHLPRQAASAAAAKVQALLLEARLEGAEVRTGDIVVLVRNGYQASLMENELRRLAIPSVRSAEENVFETTEAGDLLRVMEAVLDPGDESLWHGCLLSPVFGWKPDRLAALEADESLQGAEREKVTSLRKVFEERGFAPFFQALSSQAGIAGRWLGAQGGERRWTNWLQLGELLQDLSRREHLGPGSLTRALRDLVTGGGLRGAPPDAHLMRLETDSGAVPIVTVHKSKGLEYRFVIVPFATFAQRNRKKQRKDLRDPVKKTRDAAGRQVLDLRARRSAEEDEWVQRYDKAEDGDEQRLLYVALTRAREALFVCVAKEESEGGSPLGALLGDTLGAIVRDGEGGLPEGWAEWMSVEEAPVAKVGSWRSTPDVAPLVANEARRVWPESNLLSFSKIAAASEVGHEERWKVKDPAEEVLDRDDSSGVGVAMTSAVAEKAPGAGVAMDAHEMPSGKGVGDFFHEVFEEIDLSRPATWPDAITRRRARYALPAAIEAVAERLIGAAADLKVPGANGTNVRLGDLPAKARRAEVPFALPVKGFDQAAFASLFPGDGPREAMAERLRTMRLSPVDGYLVGTLDLVVDAGGVFHVLDWKSNRLGPGDWSYGEDSLDAAMAEHAYDVQWTLYGLALHRHLQTRLSGYDPARHLGSAVYVFLRGLERDGLAAGRGVIRRPLDVGRLEALATLLGGRDA